MLGADHVQTDLDIGLRRDRVNNVGGNVAGRIRIGDPASGRLKLRGGGLQACQ